MRKVPKSHFDLCVFLNNLEKYDTSIQIAQLIMEIWKFRSEWSNRPSPNNLRNIRLDTKQRNWCKKSGNPIPQVKNPANIKGCIKILVWLPSLGIWQRRNGHQERSINMSDPTNPIRETWKMILKIISLGNNEFEMPMTTIW